MRRPSIRLIAGVGVAAVLAAFPFAPEVFGRDGATSDGPAVKRDDPSRTPADVAMDLDFLVAAAWDREGLVPPGTCTDEEYVRRVYLDIVGTIPTADQVLLFVRDDAEDKRARLVDHLLDTPGYARHFTNLWGSTLVGEGTNDNNRDYVPGLFRRWLEQQFEADRPYAELVTDLLTAKGTGYENGAVNYAGRRAHSATDMAGAVSKHFLGVQIQCAQCHDHPYEEITQADFNGFAAFWGTTVGVPERIDYSILGARAAERAERRYEQQVQALIKQGMAEDKARQQANRRRPRTRNIQDVELMATTGRGGVARNLRRRAERELGEIAKVTPKYLLGSDFDPKASATRRSGLAGWITDTENPYTAKALANRYWGWMFGRGIVHPIDDFSSVNIPSVPQALDVLAEDTADHAFDLKRLVRVIAATKAYQLSTSVPERTPLADEFFSAGPLKEITPQQTFDSLQVALGVRKDGARMSGLYGGSPSSVDMTGGRGGMMMGTDGTEMTRVERILASMARSYFQTFEDDEGGESESFSGTVPQGLFLLNSDVINNALVQKNVSVIPQIVGDYDTVRECVRHLFLRTLSREPTAKELNKFTHFAKTAKTVEETVPTDGKTKKNKAKKRRRTGELREHAAYADLLWALISSSEFSSNN